MDKLIKKLDQLILINKFTKSKIDHKHYINFIDHGIEVKISINPTINLFVQDNKVEITAQQRKSLMGLLFKIEQNNNDYRDRVLLSNINKFIGG